MDLTEDQDLGEVVEDRLLGGAVRLRQPVRGYRAATDPVLLAAATPVTPGDLVLDLGCGAGAVSLCLAARVPGVKVHGLEVQPAYARLAEQNAALNAAAMTVHRGDMRAMPAALKELIFDVVVLNPPWHGASGSGSPNPARDMAHRLSTDMGVWLTAALSRTRPGGWIVVIQRTEALPAILTGLEARTGDIAVLPLAARAGRGAKRVIVRARKGSRGPFRLVAPFVLHDGPAHLADHDDFTEAARAILRDGAPISFQE